MKTKRKTKILSLILAITVVATMIMAVPFTASAEDTVFKLQGFDASKLTKGSTYDLKDSSETVGLTVKLLDAGNSYTSATYKDQKDSNYEYGKPSAVQPATKPSQSQGKYSSGFGFEFTPTYTGTFTAYYKLGDTKTMYLDNNTDASKNTSHKNETGSNEYEISFQVLADNTYILYVTGTGNEYYGFKFVANTSKEPSISLDKTEADVSTGEDITLQAVVSNLEDTTVTWESDAREYATVNEGVVHGVRAGSANITATASDGQTKASCKVTVKDAKDVSIEPGNGVKFELKQNGETKYEGSGKSTIKDMAYGTYDVVLTKMAPVTYTNFQTLLPQITVGVGSETSFTIGSADIVDNVDSFTGSVYSALSGSTVIWGFESKNAKPTSFGYMNLGENRTSGKTPIAGTIDGSTDSDVYMLVSTQNSGKIDSVGRDSNFQINTNTELKIPVLENSTVTVSNYTTQADSHNATYTLGKNSAVNTPGETTYTATAEDAKTGYITLTVTNGGYLSRIKVTTPAVITWGEGETDSGYYDDGSRKGVIRFIQGYTGTATGYGFYVVDKDGGIIESNKIQGSASINDAEGIYADLIDIQDNNRDSYYMKAYVVVNGTEIWGPAFGGKVNWDREVEKPTV